jgi:hypothetical protein
MRVATIISAVSSRRPEDPKVTNMIKTEEPYSKFNNDTTDGSAAPTPFPTYTPPPGPADMEKRIIQTQRRARHLATVEMIIAAIIIVFGIISTVLSRVYWSPYLFECTASGANIWAPILGIIAAGLGLGTFKRGGFNNNKCLLMGHFVMSIIVAVADGILIIFTSPCLAASRWMIEVAYDPECRIMCPPPGMVESIIAMQIVILLGAIAHMIACIVSSAFICRYWCCCGRNTGGPTVLYIPNQTTGSDGAMQAINVPAGAQIILVSAGNVRIGQQATAA